MKNSKKPFKQIPLRLSEKQSGKLDKIKERTRIGTLSGTVLRMIENYDSMLEENEKLKMDLSRARNDHQNLKNMVKNRDELSKKIRGIIYK